MRYVPTLPFANLLLRHQCNPRINSVNAFGKVVFIWYACLEGVLNTSTHKNTGTAQLEMEREIQSKNGRPLRPHRIWLNYYATQILLKTHQPPGALRLSANCQYKISRSHYNAYNVLFLSPNHLMSGDSLFKLVRNGRFCRGRKCWLGFWSWNGVRGRCWVAAALMAISHTWFCDKEAVFWVFDDVNTFVCNFEWYTLTERRY